jgi:hypothetical protein
MNCPRCTGLSAECAGHEGTLQDLSEQFGSTLGDIAYQFQGKTLKDLADAVIPSAASRSAPDAGDSTHDQDR